MKKVARLCCMVVIVGVILCGCGSSKIIEEGNQKLEEKKYEEAIAIFEEYKDNTGDSAPLHNAYLLYATDLYEQEKYMESLQYFVQSNTTENEIFNNVVEEVYQKGLLYLEEDKELLAFQYLGSVQEYRDVEAILPENPLLGIWQAGNVYIKLTKTGVSYMTSKTQMKTDEFVDDYEKWLLILGDWKVNELGQITIDDHYLSHHNNNYLGYIEVVDNDTIYVYGDDTLEYQYKRIIK